MRTDQLPDVRSKWDLEKNIMNTFYLPGKVNEFCNSMRSVVRCLSKEFAYRIIDPSAGCNNKIIIVAIKEDKL